MGPIDMNWCISVPPFQTDPFGSAARHDAIMQLKKVKVSQGRSEKEVREESAEKASAMKLQSDI